MGITTCLELRNRACDVMIAFPTIEHTFLIRCALGIGQTLHDADEDDQKGISVSETFKPLKTKLEFKQKMYELCEELAKRMLKSELAGRIVHLGIKSTSF